MVIRHKDFKVLVAGWYSEKELKKYLKQLGLEVKLFRPQEEEDGLRRDIEINAPDSKSFVINSLMETKQIGNCTSFHYNIPHNIARIVKVVMHPFFNVKNYKLNVVLYTPTIEEVIFYSKHRLEREGKVISIKVDAV